MFFRSLGFVQSDSVSPALCDVVSILARENDVKVKVFMSVQVVSFRLGDDDILAFETVMGWEAHALSAATVEFQARTDL